MRLLKRKHHLYVTAAFRAVFYDSCSLLNQILTYASDYAKISEQQAEKIRSSGLGMLTAWSPQQFILNHPVLYSRSSFYWLNT
jgi:hypothetical protein